MPVKKKSSIIESEDLAMFWKIFTKNWYIVVVFAIASVIFAYFYTYKLPDIYAAKSQILLKSDETYDYQTSLFKGLGYYQAYQDNTNQMRVITSNDLIKTALSKLNFEVSYFIVGRLKTTEVYESMPFDFVIKYINPGLYEQKMKFKILNEKEYQVTYKKGDNEMIKTFPFDSEVTDTDFIMSVNKNSNINTKSILSLKEIDYLVQIHSLNNLVNKFKYALSIENVENTTILELTLEDEIPYRAVTFLDTLSKVYIDYTAEAQYVINENTLQNINKQLAGVSDTVDTIEDELENYKSDKAVLDLPRQEDNYFDQLISYDSRKRNTQLWLQSLENLEKYILEIGNSKEDKLLPPSFYIGDNDDYLKVAINELYSMQMTRNRALFGATESNNSIEQLDQTIILLKKNILTYITNSKKGLDQKIADIESQIQDYTKIIKALPRTERGLNSIQRKVDVNEKMYVYLLEKRANTVIARAGILPQTRVIESAHNVGIVKPNKQKVTYYFLLISFVLASIVIFIRTIFFSRIENMKELKALTTLPVLGEIMLSTESDNYLIVNKDPKAPVTESFRAIRTNLEYMASEVSSKVILITSYNPGEGKTFCSVNLAAIFAKASKKVLAVELDLHKPKVQKALGMSSDLGISTILIGKSSVSESIQKTEIEGLDAILSGPTPPNASEIILSNQMKEVFDYARLNYDYVIIDTPPVGLITDALVIMKYTDISLFVLNAKYAKRQVVEIARKWLQIIKLRISDLS
ncbi:MAG: polysaccharide biosynthesis tyrosine autokinase [Bacteroidota bacterium]|nr:polysaccharide biosynthesis tyrosine autokinase [Bacteroidota bacterium]